MRIATDLDEEGQCKTTSSDCSERYKAHSNRGSIAIDDSDSEVIRQARGGGQRRLQDGRSGFSGEGRGKSMFDNVVEDGIGGYEKGRRGEFVDLTKTRLTTYLPNRKLHLHSEKAKD